MKDLSDDELHLIRIALHKENNYDLMKKFTSELMKRDKIEGLQHPFLELSYESCNQFILTIKQETSQLLQFSNFEIYVSTDIFTCLLGHVHSSRTKNEKEDMVSLIHGVEVWHEKRLLNKSTIIKITKPENQKIN